MTTTTPRPVDTPAAAPPPRRSPDRIRVRTPTVLQMEAVECGAAALGIVLAHHGRWVPLEELRSAAGVSRDGSNAAALVRAARCYGLTATGYRRSTLEALRRSALPCVLFWRLNHFLVLEGWRSGRWYLNDPATGPRVADDDEMDAAYSGIVLEFAPGPDFQRGGERPAPARRLVRRLRTHRPEVLYVILASLVLLGPGLAVPALSAAFVDGFLVAGHESYVPAVLIGLAGAALVTATVTYWQQRVVNGLRSVLTSEIVVGQVQRLLRLPMRFYAQRPAGDLAYRAGLGTTVAGLLSGPVISAALGSAVAAVYLLVVVAISPLLGLVVALLFVTVLLVRRLVARRQRDLGHRQMRDQIEAAVVQSSSVELIESIKAEGSEDEAILAIGAARRRLLAVRQQQDLAMRPLLAVPTAITALGGLAVLSLGAVQVMDGTLSLGALLAVQVLIGSVLGPVGLLASVGGQLDAMAATSARLDDVDRAVIDPAFAPGPGTSPGPDVHGRIELRAVRFGYDPVGRTVLRDVDITVPAGSRVAVVGASGSGKSTVARLVAGLFEPTGGAVLIDGRPRSAWPRDLLTADVGFVDQECCLFRGTIRENITLFDPRIDDDAVGRAVRDAGLVHVVDARPQGVDSLLGPGGAGLSGGEQQRIEIARALARDPAVLILDEATSALDPTTEQAVDLALRRRGCTCLIIAHRLSTVRDADEIVVLDRGRVVERGTHAELLRLDGHYARLVGT